MSDKFDINYDKLVEKSLKFVVIEALQIAAEEGLNGDNHFYITFQTTHPSVRLSSQLLNEYPNEMTIVLQHQFANLMLSDEYFEVDLSFSGVLQTLRIAYDSIVYFADPYAKFALSFNVADETQMTSVLHQEQTPAKKTGAKAEVVSIADFRKKHA